MGGPHFSQVFQSDHDSVLELLLTIFRMAALEWFAAVDINSSDSAIKVPTVMRSLDYIF